MQKKLQLQLNLLNKNLTDCEKHLGQLQKQAFTVFTLIIILHGFSTQSIIDFFKIGLDLSLYKNLLFLSLIPFATLILIILDMTSFNLDSAKVFTKKINSFILHSIFSTCFIFLIISLFFIFLN